MKTHVRFYPRDYQPGHQPRIVQILAIAAIKTTIAKARDVTEIRELLRNGLLQIATTNPEVFRTLFRCEISHVLRTFGLDLLSLQWTEGNQPASVCCMTPLTLNIPRDGSVGIVRIGGKTTPDGSGNDFTGLGSLRARIDNNAAAYLAVDGVGQFQIVPKGTSTTDITVNVTLSGTSLDGTPIPPTQVDPISAVILGTGNPPPPPPPPPAPGQAQSIVVFQSTVDHSAALPDPGTDTIDIPVS